MLGIQIHRTRVYSNVLFFFYPILAQYTIQSVHIFQINSIKSRGEKNRTRTLYYTHNYYYYYYCYLRTKLIQQIKGKFKGQIPFVDNSNRT